MSKKKKKKKVILPKEFVVPEIKQKPMKTIDKRAWEMARVMTKMRPDKRYVNKKMLCKRCGLYYCLGFDGIDVYCEGCYYQKGCVKEVETERNCHRCTDTTHIDWWGVYV